jgi:hypothetical protein
MNSFIYLFILFALYSIFPSLSAFLCYFKFLELGTNSFLIMLLLLNAQKHKLQHDAYVV